MNTTYIKRNVDSGRCFTGSSGITVNNQRNKQRKREYPHYNLSCTDVSKFVMYHFEIPLSELKGESRVQWFVKARHVFCYLVFHFSRVPLETIGKFLNDRDHATVIYSVESITNAISIQDDRTVPHVEVLKAKLLQLEPKSGCAPVIDIDAEIISIYGDNFFAVDAHPSVFIRG